MASIGETFKQQIQSGDTITLNENTRHAIHKYWQHEYHTGGINYKEGIVAGLERMEPWITEIKEIFTNYEIPQEYIYLAIAESHFDMDAISHKAAVGPYQIIPKTALRYGLTVTNTYDERRDPIKSAKLCAKHLRDSYENFGNDWRLALMDYNGGYTNKYIEHIIDMEEQMRPDDIEKQRDTDDNVITFNLPKEKTLGYVANKFNTSITRLKKINDIKDEDVRKLSPGTKLIIPTKREITFDAFNRWLENEINQKIENEIMHRNYTVVHGDILGTIAKANDVDYQEIKKINNLTSDNITPNQKLKLPPPNPSKRVREILKLISSYHENINYPGKFFAINDIIEQENLSQILEGTKKKYKEMKIPKMEMATLHPYTVQKGNIFSNIVQFYKDRYPKYTALHPNLAQLIKEQNNISNEGKIRAGQKIKLSLSVNKSSTLSDIAQQYNYDINQLAQLNPAILDNNIPLTEFMTLRTPL